MSRQRRGPNGHGYARKFVRRGPLGGIGEPAPAEEEESLSGAELWEKAMEGPADNPGTFAACASILPMLVGHLAEAVVAVQAESGLERRQGLAVLAAWEHLDEEEDLLAMRATILVLAERIRLLIEALGIDTEGWLEDDA